MRKVLLPFLFLTSCVCESHAQAPSITWAKCFGGDSVENGTTVTPTSDGGYILGGTTYGNGGEVTGTYGNGDYWVVKINSIGTLQWEKSLGGSDLDRMGKVLQTADGGYLAAGTVKSDDGAVTGNHGEVDVWIVKLDSTGAIVWQKCYGGSGGDTFSDIEPTTDGNYIFIATTGSMDGDVTSAHGDGDYWAVKINSAGAILWQKTYGGSLDDLPTKITPLDDGGYIMVGQTRSIDGEVTGHTDITDYDCWIVRTDDTGKLLWEKTMGSTTGDIAFGAVQTPDGGFMVAARTTGDDGDVSGNHGGSDAWLVRLNATGTIIWSKCLGGSGSDGLFNVIQMEDTGFILSGQTTSTDGDVSGNHGAGDYWVVRIDTSGNIIWQKCFGGSVVEQGGFICADAAGGYVIAGASASNDGDVTGNHGEFDYWLVKLGGSSSGLPANAGATDIAIYPNPSASTIRVQCTENVSTELVDLNGKIVIPRSTNKTLSLAELAPGVYLLNVYDQSSDRIKTSEVTKE